MKTLKQVAVVCLVAALALSMMAPLFGADIADTGATGPAIHNGQIPFDEVPTPTPTVEAGTDSNPSGGGSGGG